MNFIENPLSNNVTVADLLFLVLLPRVSDSGYKRTWQQVKVKHKNIVQTGSRVIASLLYL